jgi:hypothetical protein
VGNTSGSGELKLAGAHVRGLNLSVLPPLLSATDQIKSDITADKVLPIVQTLLNNGEAQLPPEVSIPFNIATGAVRTTSVQASNDLAKLSGKAEISLADERMSGSLGIDFNAGSEALSGAEPAVRLDFAGPLATPGRTLDVTDITSFLSLRAFERERRRIERLQANVLEKQRLRREIALYKFNASEREVQRQRDLQVEQERSFEEKRLRALALQADAQRKAEAEAKAKLEAAAKAKADAEAQAKAKADAEAQAKAEAAARAKAEAQQLPVLNGQPQTGGALNFNGLPGVAR